MTATSRPTARSIPPWRDSRVVGLLVQAAVVAAVAVGAWVLTANLLSAMDARGLVFVPGFLGTTAGFEIAESLIGYEPVDSFGHALLTGLVNTILVSVLGVLFATVLGVLVGVARLSDNWLLSRLSAGYVELFRNTPLLVQLFVIYFAVLLQLPAVRDSLVLGDLVFLNQRGVSLPRPIAGSSAVPWMLALAAGVGAAVVAWVWAGRRVRDGRPARGIRAAGLASLVALPAAGWVIAGSAPFTLELPVRGTFNVRGGMGLSPEFTALLVGLVLYTAAFIGEIVRGGIQAVPKGQLEAGRALGLSEGSLLRLVVLPQALRVIVPPLTSQYLNLIKNSSLAIAIGYPDLFNVSTTVANITGQPVAVIGLVMLVYLVLSLVAAAIMGVVNRRVQLRER